MLNSSSTQQRVFIVGEGALLDDGITQLLEHKTNSLVSRAVHSDENAIKSNESDAVLICESDSVDTSHILNLISSPGMAALLLIMIIRLRNNVIDIYPRPTFVAGKVAGRPQRIVARTGEDLVNALKLNLM